jgi:hypothetical protein
LEGTGAYQKTSFIQKNLRFFLLPKAKLLEEGGKKEKSIDDGKNLISQKVE